MCIKSVNINLIRNNWVVDSVVTGNISFIIERNISTKRHLPPKSTEKRLQQQTQHLHQFAVTRWALVHFNLFLTWTFRFFFADVCFWNSSQQKIFYFDRLKLDELKHHPSQQWDQFLFKCNNHHEFDHVRTKIIEFFSRHLTHCDKNNNLMFISRVMTFFQINCTEEISEFYERISNIWDKNPPPMVCTANKKQLIELYYTGYSP